MKSHQELHDLSVVMQFLTLFVVAKRNMIPFQGASASVSPQAPQPTTAHTAMEKAIL